MSDKSTHDQIVARITAMAHQRGMQVHYCGSATWCAGKGFPDLVIVGQSYTVFAEVKPHALSKVSPEQTTWKHALLASGEQYRLWTAYDLDSKRIEFELDRMM